MGTVCSCARCALPNRQRYQRARPPSLKCAKTLDAQQIPLTPPASGKRRGREGGGWVDSSVDLLQLMVLFTTPVQPSQNAIAMMRSWTRPFANCTSPESYNLRAGARKEAKQNSDFQLCRPIAPSKVKYIKKKQSEWSCAKPDRPIRIRSSLRHDRAGATMTCLLLTSLTRRCLRKS